MEKLTIQSLKGLLDFIEMRSDTVFWIRDKTLTRQLYISPSYESIWRQNVESLYDHPLSWNDYLFVEDKELILKCISNEIKFANDVPSLETLNNNTMLYRIKNSSDSVKFIRSTRFFLINDKNEHIGFCGIGEVISEQQWHEEKEKKQFAPEDIFRRNLKAQLFNLLKTEFNLYTSENLPKKSEPILLQSKLKLEHDGKLLQLTDRETECLQHLISGKSSKQTGALMCISPRTVEFHLNNIKMKAHCRTKLEILSKVNR